LRTKLYGADFTFLYCLAIPEDEQLGDAVGLNLFEIEGSDSTSNLPMSGVLYRN
jgi:hypothetical protein